MPTAEVVSETEDIIAPVEIQIETAAEGSPDKEGRCNGYFEYLDEIPPAGKAFFHLAGSDGKSGEDCVRDVGEAFRENFRTVAEGLKDEPIDSVGFLKTVTEAVQTVCVQVRAAYEGRFEEGKQIEALRDQAITSKASVAELKRVGEGTYQAEAAVGLIRSEAGEYPWDDIVLYTATYGGNLILMVTRSGGYKLLNRPPVGSLSQEELSGLASEGYCRKLEEDIKKRTVKLEDDTVRIERPLENAFGAENPKPMFTRVNLTPHLIRDDEVAIVCLNEAMLSKMPVSSIVEIIKKYFGNQTQAVNKLMEATGDEKFMADRIVGMMKVTLPEEQRIKKDRVTDEESQRVSTLVAETEQLRKQLAEQEEKFKGKIAALNEQLQKVGPSDKESDEVVQTLAEEKARLLKTVVDLEDRLARLTGKKGLSPKAVGGDKEARRLRRELAEALQSEENYKKALESAREQARADFEEAIERIRTASLQTIEALVDVYTRALKRAGVAPETIKGSSEVAIPAVTPVPEVKPVEVIVDTERIVSFLGKGLKDLLLFNTPPLKDFSKPGMADQLTEKHIAVATEFVGLFETIEGPEAMEAVLNAYTGDKRPALLGKSAEDDKAAVIRGSAVIFRNFLRAFLASKGVQKQVFGKLKLANEDQTVRLKILEGYHGVLVELSKWGR